MYDDEIVGGPEIFVLLFFAEELLRHHRKQVIGVRQELLKTLPLEYPKTRTCSQISKLRRSPISPPVRRPSFRIYSDAPALLCYCLQSISCCYVDYRGQFGRRIPNLKATPPMKIALLVEPTPFNYISGYSNRFREMLK